MRLNVIIRRVSPVYTRTSKQNGKEFTQRDLVLEVCSPNTLHPDQLVVHVSGEVADTWNIPEGTYGQAFISIETFGSVDMNRYFQDARLLDFCAEEN